MCPHMKGGDKDQGEQRGAGEVGTKDTKVSKMTHNESLIIVTESRKWHEKSVSVSRICL